MKGFTTSVIIGAICLSYSLLFAGCDTENSISNKGVDKLNVKISSLTFNTPSITNGKTPIETLDGYLYIKGTLVRIYPNLASDIGELKLPMIFYNGINASLFLVANTQSVQTSLSSLIVGSSKESEFPLPFTNNNNIAINPLPLALKIDLSTTDLSQPLDIKLKHAHARLDLNIDEQNVEITSIEFKNLPKEGLLIRNAEAPAKYTGEVFNYNASYTNPLTSTQTIGYINEGSNLNIPVLISGRFNGLEVRMSVTLPAQIERNKIYTIQIIKIGATLTAQVEAENWEDGDTTNGTPDINAKVLIDSSNSIFPAGVRCSATNDTLFLPSKEENVIMALKADYEVETSISGYESGLSVVPSDGYNRFQVKAAGQFPGAPAYYSYIKIKNKFFENYYADRIVVQVAPDTDVALADNELLSTVPGITISNNLATISPYGSASITIQPEKIKSGNDLFATINSILFASELPDDYKAIKMTKSGNNIVVQSAPNYSITPQCVTATVRGADKNGKPIAAVLSITIPEIPASEAALLNKYCIPMGGQSWMQINTSGSIEQDIRNLRSIDQKYPVSNITNIGKDYNLFGLTWNTYNTTPECPPGYRTPTQQEFYNLFGVQDEASSKILNTVATAPVNTPGGMNVSYKLFSSVERGQAAVAISKDNHTVFLTNARFLAPPGRYYFEFWYQGSFGIALAYENPYNWARRCVKDTNYKGLK